MASVGIAELKDRASELVERAGGGEVITITRHGKPVAKLIGLAPLNAADVEDLLQRMKAGRTASLGDLDWKELRDIGRR